MSVEEKQSSNKNMIRFTFKQVNESINKYRNSKNDYMELKSFLSNSIEEYNQFCEDLKVSPGDVSGFDEYFEYEIESILPDWMSGYYFQLEDMVAENIGILSDDFVTGLKSRAFSDANKLINETAEIDSAKKDLLTLLFNENSNDVFELYQNLYLKGVKTKGRDDAAVSSIFRGLSGILVRIESEKLDKEEFYKGRMEAYEQALDKAQEIMDGRKAKEELFVDVDINEIGNSLRIIVDYSKVDDEIAKEFIEDIEIYRNTVNKNSISEENRKLKERLTRNFYEIYTSAFLNSVTDENLPVVLKMFFNFGYIDEELSGTENAVFMYQICQKLPTDPEKGIFSYYEWLLAIYYGERNPSRNEFDVDYTEFLHDELMNHRITKEQEKELLSDKIERVKYELEQVLPSLNKTTSGRITTFCPVFSEHTVLKDLPSMLVDSEKIDGILTRIRSVDYSAFYRQTVFSAPERGVNREYIDVEILPDIILTPNVGSRAMMWQEIEGKRRTTPARMFISIFEQEELGLQMLRLVGQFRWEMCKRVQGSRWNDVTDRSLTSLYFDYVQYFRKNKDLSADAKAKIKTELTRSKNSFREMFIRDYISWIKYESEGSPRLNKVARAIMLEYVPFSSEIRAKLMINPMYREQIERYEIRQKAKIHKIDNLMVKIRNLRQQIPEEIIRQKEYLGL